MADDMDLLSDSRSQQQELAGDANAFVSDLVDVDRTFELVAWLWGGLFAKGSTEQAGGDAASPLQPPATMTTATTAAAAAAAAAAAVGQGAAGASSTGSSAASTASAASSSPTPSPGPSPSPSPGPSGRTEVATLGGGCFWCVEACYAELYGVVRATSGYSGGHAANPTYKQVCDKKTGHAEVVQVEYDPSILSYRDILQIFFSVHDPTTPDRQGGDVGPQYRSVVFYHDQQQQEVAEEVMREARKDGWFGMSRPVCTQLLPAAAHAFYPAEPVHQRYYARNPSARYCTLVVAPKLSAFRRKYSKLLKSQRDADAADDLMS